ncbi:hypothetical protein QYF36_007941 [Acer negundo]|nr:hypothetical protein QYF36_007941 [Acer negundo]
MVLRYEEVNLEEEAQKMSVIKAKPRMVTHTTTNTLASDVGIIGSSKCWEPRAEGDKCYPATTEEPTRLQVSTLKRQDFDDLDLKSLLNLLSSQAFIDALLRDRLVPQLATTGSEALGSPGEARAAEEAVCTHNSCWSEQTSAVPYLRKLDHEKEWKP